MPSSSPPGGGTHENTSWPASPPASPSFARSRWRPRRRPAGASSRPRWPTASRLVQVGFMRRYDAAYRALKDVVDQRCHRHPPDDALRPPQRIGTRRTTPATWRSTIPRSTTLISSVGCSTMRWRRPGAGASPQQPAPATCATRSISCSRWPGGALVDVEVSVNIAYGYDIRGEIIGETRPAALAESNAVVVKREAPSTDGCRRTGATGSSAPSTPSSRSGRGRRRRHRHRPQRLGRLCRHRGLRRRIGILTERHPHDRVAAPSDRTSTPEDASIAAEPPQPALPDCPLRQLSVVLDDERTDPALQRRG